MNRLQRASLLSLLTDRLIEQNGWCGEATIQKTTYFLQELLGVPMEFRFVLYKYGPLSFDLRDELTAMRADGLIELRSHQTFGSILIPTPSSRDLRDRYARTVSQFEPQLRFVVDRFAGEKLGRLDLLATTRFVRTGLPDAPSERHLAEIQEIIPHVSPSEARDALDYIDEVVAESKNVQVPSPLVVG